MKYVFAGDRDISVTILKFILEKGYPPSALLVTEKNKASHADKLAELAELPAEWIFHGKDFSSSESIEKLKSLHVDYIISIHFPYVISKSVLKIPAVGFLNLHPAFLPYNKGWHTPSWAIIENTIYGATLHFMSEQLDTGDIVHQKICPVNAGDTANILYQRVKESEVEVFKEAFPFLISLNPPRKKQNEVGTSHFKKDLLKYQPLSLQKEVKTGDLINKLRALTTNNIEEAAYYIMDGKKYFVQVSITEKKDQE
jgi:Methionyl-tRNA formyltransferase